MKRQNDKLQKLTETGLGFFCRLLGKKCACLSLPFCRRNDRNSSYVNARPLVSPASVEKHEQLRSMFVQQNWRTLSATCDSIVLSLQTYFLQLLIVTMKMLKQLRQCHNTLCCPCDLVQLQFAFWVAYTFATSYNRVWNTGCSCATQALQVQMKHATEYLFNIYWYRTPILQCLAIEHRLSNTYVDTFCISLCEWNYKL